MKRRIVFVICFVLIVSAVAGLFSYSRAATDYTYVRVKLSIGTPTSFSFLVDGNYSVSGQALERQLYTVSIEGSQLKLSLGNTTVYQGNTVTLEQHAATPGLNNSIYLYNTRYSAYLRYPGNLAFTISGGSIQAVSRIYIEDYVCGVLAGEMGNSWPEEALKAQAVAARTFVAKRIKTTGSYDVVDTSSDQAFKGYDASYTRIISAVSATSGMVLTYGGQIIDAYFGASNGGWTELMLHNFSGGTDVPYYQIQVDSFDTANTSSLYETVFFPSVIDGTHPVTAADNTTGTPNISNAIAYIKHVIVESGQLSSLGVTSADDFELTGISELEGVDGQQPQATTQTSAEMPQPSETGSAGMDFASATPAPEETPEPSASATPAPEETPEPSASATPAPEETPEPSASVTPAPEETPEPSASAAETSQPVSEDAVPFDAATEAMVELTGVTALTAHTPDTDGAYNDRPTAYSTIQCVDFIKATGSFAVTVNGMPATVQNVELDLRYFDASNGNPAYQVFNNTSLRLFVVQADTQNGVAGFSISHRRYGHGVGLSQRGAQQRANAGQAYQDILTFYYPNTTLTSLGVSAPSLPAALPSGYDNGTIVNTSDLNVRSGPSTSYSALGKLPGGARVELMEAGVASDWYMFNYGGTAAYIHESYVQQDTDTLVSSKFIRRGGELYISAGTTCDTLLNSLKGYTGTVIIRNAAGAVIWGGTTVGAGATITLADGSGNTLNQVAISLKGDVNGDGLINVSDYTQIRLHILRMITLDSYGAQMADTNGDSVIDISDYTRIRLYILGLWSIN